MILFSLSRFSVLLVLYGLAFETQAQLLTIDAGPDLTLCGNQQSTLGGTPTASGGGGVYTYNWAPTAGLDNAFLANPVCTAAATTVYSLTVTDNLGNSAVDSITMTMQPAPPSAIASAEQDTVCANGSILLHAAWIPDATYQWTGPWGFNTSIQDPVTSASEGLFEVTAYLGACAGPSSSVYITVLPGQSVAAGNDTALCGSSGPIDLIMGQPNGGVWTGPGVVAGSPYTFDPALAGPSNTLTYTWGAGGECPNSDELLILVNVPPVAAYTSDSIACQNTPTAFNDMSSGATTWYWDLGDGLGTSTSPSPEYTYADTGTFIVTLIVGAGAGCADTLTGPVAVWSAPMVGFTVDVAEGCGPLTVEFDLQSSGASVAYAWDLGYGPGSTDADPAPVTYPACLSGDTTYTVVLNGGNSCGTAGDQALITVHAGPSAAFETDADAGCSPWTVTSSNLSTGQGDLFQWFWGDGTSCFCQDSVVQHLFITDSLALLNTITLIATNACGTDTATSVITVQPPAAMALFTASTTQGCVPLLVDFTPYSTGLTSWSWNFNGTDVGSDTSASFTYTEPGTWICTLTGTSTCGSDTANMQIIAEAAPVAAFNVLPASPLVGVPANFINLSDNSGDISWTFGDGGTSTLPDPSHTYLIEGIYPVTLTVTGPLNACTATVEQGVEVLPVESGPEEPLVWVPDAFTPDGNGVNDSFLAVVSGYSTCDYEFNVFDRWGTPIFHTEEPSASWDGRTNGNASPLGVYTWHVSFRKCTDVRERIAKPDFFGHVLLLSGE